MVLSPPERIGAGPVGDVEWSRSARICSDGRVIGAVRGLLAVLLVGSALSWTSAASAAGPAVEGERAFFTGTFVGDPEVRFEDGARVRVYRVAVEKVYGPVDITTQRVQVRASVALERCPAAGGGQQGQQEQPGQGGQNDAGTAGQAGQGSGQGSGQDPTQDPADGTQQPDDAPTSPPTGQAPTGDRQLRLFEAVVQDAGYLVPTCSAVAIASGTVLSSLVERYGEGRAPGSNVTPPPDPFDAVAYLCPDTDDALNDLDDPASCETLQDDQSFDRAAAPGLALVIVGVLGLLLARRLARRT